ncbi:MAG: hypothetical protein AB7I38_17130 [Dehalococcoidia bacterium]
MVVGQYVTKQTWMLGDVEVRGVVSLPGHNPGDDVGAGDSFDIVPDNGYQHLVDLMPGSHGLVHCETYPLPAGHSNHNDAWPLPMKPGNASFQVRDPISNARRPLAVGDHVRVVGQWTIDHHPEQCVTRNRGLLRVGCAWPELHPFHWDDISLIVPLRAGDVERRTISVAAPIHEECYLRDWKWFANELAGVASKIFITDDGSNYHNTVAAHMRIPAPPLPLHLTPNTAQLVVGENILKNGTILPLNVVRNITQDANGVDIRAAVAAPTHLLPLPWRLFSNLQLADVNGPAGGVQVFQATYTVSWTDRFPV